MPLSAQQRDAVVTEAKTWIGTPYRGWSRLKGAGTDCGQIIYGVFRNCRLVPEVELPKDYSLQLAQHRESTEYVGFIEQFCREIPEAEVQAADIVVYKLGLAFAHAAIVIEWPDFVLHAEARHGVSGAHGTKTPLFLRKLTDKSGYTVERIFYTLKDEYVRTLW